MKMGHRWPVITDFDRISMYATASGGRLPTEVELRLFYNRFEFRGSNVGFRNWHSVL